MRQEDQLPIQTLLPMQARPRRCALAALALFAACAGAGSVRAQPENGPEKGAEKPAESGALARLVGSAPFKAARQALADDHERFVAEIITLTEIPAPPFKEEARARAFAAMLKASGLADVTMDSLGNVVARRPGRDPSLPPLIVAAHLDTVFPEGTDVGVRREGTRLLAPGIGDDTRGLAQLLALVRAMDRARISTRRDLVFVGNVGEEGAGDLRGMRHLFASHPAARNAAGFITIDGSGAARITTTGVGSRRFRLTFAGPGGHSFEKFGIVNPVAALARTVSGLYAVPVPAEPRTTFSASIIGGGTSVNAIPAKAFVEIDIRSAAPAEIARIDRALHDIAQAAVDEENAARSTAMGRITVSFETIGDRPAGTTLPSSALARHAHDMAVLMGLQPAFIAQSTDANVPMSLGIPAIAIGTGGRGGGEHTLGEWIDVSKDEAVQGMAVVLGTILASAD
ncbi:M20/M25/M40 family metallo-hydrolase [Novosphingobium sp.]|uniref:M20/M25/M40 family metallo-hydrolase n=1 Tax=Novosphingobium sp. TaxID=1874826 RepID=UPI002625073D|nr:M20/M25/M40 family metallo-hydrolase [Novosphingobium sp.]